MFKKKTHFIQLGTSDLTEIFHCSVCRSSKIKKPQQQLNKNECNCLNFFECKLCGLGYCYC